ncbi:ankyrin repeat protein [Acanthamoeba polyphaga mimivirus]|uniref:Ankyrin repeat protein n=1 Tax=Acanthamoeba polyphaga mimivirus Kroon TaxID=3069720 RepID=A0A0G2Y9J6_9VIRU|nr:ankyrin repeat protein [Acanthamoeba polyphaga mimivirus]AKI79786.1 ankyrin repeat protein [Acanthamoeba polyphaga mimivirus Kroon]
MSKSKMYFKILNSTRKHNDFQYVDGLNVLQEEFNDNKFASCVPGRLYFTKAKYIFRYINYGIYLRDIELPIHNPKFKMIKDPNQDKYGANMLILGTERNLSDPKTWEYMINVGANINDDSIIDHILKQIIKMHWIDVLKYLLNTMKKNNQLKILNVSKHIMNCIDYNKNDMVKIFIEKFDFSTYNDFYLTKWYKCAINSNNYKIAKYIYPAILNCKFSEKEIKNKGHILFKLACINCDFNMIKIVTESGFRCKIYEKLLRPIVDRSRLDILKYLVDNNFELDLNYIYILRLASNKRDVSMLKYLIDLGFDISKNYEICYLAAYYHGNINIVRYLISMGFDLLVQDVNENFLPYCKKINVITYICDTYMINSEGKLEIIKLLVEHGVNYKANNYEAFLLACKRDHNVIVEYLYSLGIDNDTINEAIMITYKHNSIHTFKFWISLEIDYKTIINDIYHHKNDCKGNCEFHDYTYSRCVDKYIQEIEELRHDEKLVDKEIEMLNMKYIKLC